MSRNTDLTIELRGAVSLRLQEIACRRNIPLHDVVNRMIVVLFRADELSREGFELGLAKDPKKLDVHLTNLWK